MKRINNFDSSPVQSHGSWTHGAPPLPAAPLITSEVVKGLWPDWFKGICWPPPVGRRTWCPPWRLEQEVQAASVWPPQTSAHGGDSVGHDWVCAGCGCVAACSGAAECLLTISAAAAGAAAARHGLWWNTSASSTLFHVIPSGIISALIHPASWTTNQKWLKRNNIHIFTRDAVNGLRLNYIKPVCAWFSSSS